MTKMSKGFEISLHQERNIVRVRVWGCWDPVLAKNFEEVFQEKIHEISAVGKPWSILADFSKFFPLWDEVQNVLREQLAAAAKQGMQKIGYLGKEAVLQWPLKRLFQNNSQPRSAFFESEMEAIEWLLSKE